MVDKKLLRESGFTLLELMVIITLAVIMTQYAILSYADVSSAYKRQRLEFQFEAALNKAIERARRFGARSVIQTADDGKSFVLGIDNLPYSSDLIELDETIATYTLNPRFEIEPKQSIIVNHHGNLINKEGVLINQEILLKEKEGADFINFKRASISATGQIFFEKL